MPVPLIRPFQVDFNDSQYWDPDPGNPGLTPLRWLFTYDYLEEFGHQNGEAFLNLAPFAAYVPFPPPWTQEFIRAILPPGTV